MNFQLEICIDSVASAEAAREGGADRLEVCSSLAAGGTTPSEGLVRACLEQVGLPVMMMIRPRDGDFVYSAADLAVMLRDIEVAQRLKVEGVVFGALTKQRRLDRTVCRQLLQAAAGLKITFHRAFDVAEDPLATLEELIDLGFDCLLTSGQQSTAEEGMELITQLNERAAERIAIMPGAGVNPANAAAILRNTGANQLHASASEPVAMSSHSQIQFGPPQRVTSAAKVRAIREAEP